MPAMKISLLGGLSARKFISRYWQKQPLLVRGAVPGFGAMLSPQQLAGLACEEDVQSRLVLQRRGQWKLEQGPFDEQRFARLPPKGWSLLVQGVNQWLPEAEALLHRFDFIPRARLDDLMVSLAPDGGGVGPHFDSYDVFLLQGRGKRLWRVSHQQDHALLEGAPLRILKDFRCDQEWLLEPGDMLYLPPRLAHWGIAVGECMTWSIGFRAPSRQELATQFLIHLQDQLELEGLYADPDLHYQKRPAHISGQMRRRVGHMLREALQWDSKDVTRFLGRYLTEPKPHILFQRPSRTGLEQFRSKLALSGIQLDLASQMLFHGKSVFINGEEVEATGTTLKWLTELADHRRLPAAAELPQPVIVFLHQWYSAGYLRF